MQNNEKKTPLDLVYKKNLKNIQMITNIIDKINSFKFIKAANKNKKSFKN